MLTISGSRCTVGGEVGQTRGVKRERQHQVGDGRSPRVSQARRRRRRGRGGRRGVPPGRMGGHHEVERAQAAAGRQPADAERAELGAVGRYQARVCRVCEIPQRPRRPEDPVCRRRRREQSGDRHPAGAEARRRAGRRRDRGDLLLEHPARRARHDRAVEGADGGRQCGRERDLPRSQVGLHLADVVLELPARRPARPVGGEPDRQERRCRDLGELRGGAGVGAGVPAGVREGGRQPRGGSSTRRSRRRPTTSRIFSRRRTAARRACGRSPPAAARRSSS